MRYLFMRFPEGKTKAVTFSYDDGAKADMRLADILSENGLKGTFNISSARQTEFTIPPIKPLISLQTVNPVT